MTTNTLERIVLTPARASVAPAVHKTPSSLRALRITSSCAALSLMLNVASKLGLAVALALQLPAWVVPMINPMPYYLARSAAHDALWIYLLVGVLRLGLADPINYLLGKYASEAAQETRSLPRMAFQRLRRSNYWVVRAGAGYAVYWLSKLFHNAVIESLRPLGRLIRRRVLGPLWTIQQAIGRKFHRWGYIFVFLQPNSWMMMFSGASGLKVRYLVAADVAGTVVWLLLIAFLGEHMPFWIMFLFNTLL